MLKGTLLRVLLKASILQGTVGDFQGTAEAQGAALIFHNLPLLLIPQLRKKQNEGVSSVKLGRNKDESNLSEEHHDQGDHNHTAFVYEDFDATDAVTPDLERKSDETEEVIIKEEKDTSDVKSGDTEELDLKTDSKVLLRTSVVTPWTLNFD
ncbi:hypothetical protein Tco_1197648 [Tanacetum coccineum]